MKLNNHIIYPYKEKEALRNRYGQTLADIGKKDPDVVVLDADLSTSTKTSIFKKEYPSRHFDMGIAEADMIGTAAGMAASGLKPYASSFAMFAIGRAFDQVRNAIAYADLSVRIVPTHAGLTVGEDGGSHQMLEDVAMMRVLPNMNVIIPADAEETEQVIRFSVNFNHPLFIRLSRENFPLFYKKNYKFKLGKWDEVVEGENELVIIACGLMTYYSIKAAEMLEKEGIHATVINASSIKPFDKEMLNDKLQKAKLIITVEEALISGGLGGLVSEFSTDKKPVPIYRIGIDDRFGESGTSQALLEGFELTPDHLFKKILNRWRNIK